MLGDLSTRCSLFDLQVNGFGGVDFQQPALTRSELLRALDALAAHETHRILLTLITDKIDALCRKFARIEEMRGADARIAAVVCGYHLEGPWLSAQPGFCGAHPAERMGPPSLRDFELLQEAAGGNIRLVTLAPEWPHSPDFIAELARRNVRVSLGHTDASEQQIDDAICAGATLCTHLGNGTPITLPRHGNIMQRLLARDELTACLIPDGVHLPRFTLRNFFRAKPAGKVLLTTDAMAAAGAPDGLYRLGSSEVESRNGIVRKPGHENFAGSCLTPDRGVTNAAAWLGIPVHEARALFSTRVAEIFAIDLPLLPTPLP